MNPTLSAIIALSIWIIAILVAKRLTRKAPEASRNQKGPAWEQDEPWALDIDDLDDSEL